MLKLDFSLDRYNDAAVSPNQSEERVCLSLCGNRNK